MKVLLGVAVLACGFGAICHAARCTTALDLRVLSEYQSYVATVEQGMAARFGSHELGWVNGTASRDAAADLASGKLVRSNISDAALNRRIAGQDGTVIRWVGAVLIRGATVAHLKSVLEDYEHYDRIYGPMMFACRAKRNGASDYAATFGLYHKFRLVSVFPQHFAFRVKARIDYSDAKLTGGTPLSVHLRSDEIRESDSGVPGRNDFLQQYHDHGVMWALNAYWRARQDGPDVYLELETITLARSVQAFVCKLGFVPVPKSMIAAVMDTLPAESLETILEGTRAECARMAAH
jgi:hypothetical protein